MGDTEPWLCSHGHYQGQDCGECAPMTDLPDAVVDAAAEAIRARGRQLLGPQGPGLSDSKDLAITALAAASGPWAEQLDAARTNTDEALAEAAKAGCGELVERLQADLAAALARNAELTERAKDYEERYEIAHQSFMASESDKDKLRAELDSLRDRVNALADDAVFADFGQHQPFDGDDEEVVLAVRQSALRAALVRGSDDE